jgi:hypothetical protein
VSAGLVQRRRPLGFDPVRDAEQRAEHAASQESVDVFHSLEIRLSCISLWKTCVSQKKSTLLDFLFAHLIFVHFVLADFYVEVNSDTLLSQLKSHIHPREQKIFPQMI